MASRYKQLFSPSTVNDLRARINAGQAIDILNKVIAGKLEISTARIRMVRLALEKTVPSLSAVEVSGPDGDRIVFGWVGDMPK